MPRLLLLTSLLAGTVLSQVHEVPLPDFDLPKAAASYVVCVPPGYDASRRWPLILDFHGAIAPERKGANLTAERLWSRFVAEVPCIVAGPNGRTRSWGRTQGEKDDRAYALRVLEEVRSAYEVDPARIYLAGFSSGSDFLCSGGLQAAGPFAASLVVCPGPPSVVGLKDGSLLRAKDHPFVFATGAADVIRKSGAWQAFLAIDGAGGRALYREVPGKAHEFFEVAEYAHLFRELENLARGGGTQEPVKEARAALERGDVLRASSLLAGSEAAGARSLQERIAQMGAALLEEAEGLDSKAEPGRSYETWWLLRTQFHRTSDLAGRAQAALDRLGSGRELYAARRRWMQTHQEPPAGPSDAPSSPRGDQERPAAERSEAPAPGGDQERPVAASPDRPGQDPAADTALAATLWTFDHYPTYPEVTAGLRDLARRFPKRARLLSMGRSIEGRDLWVLELTDRTTGAPEDKPAIWIQGALHGNEISALATTLYCAWQMAANPDRSRGTDRLMARTVLYVAPDANPDGAHHFLTEPHSHWRPRFNYRPNDADGDGRIDEDSYEDLDGDGEIGQMYRPAKDGPFVLRDGKLVRGEGTPRYEYVGREGLDDDGDGRFSEDPPGGVNLNRNFPVGFRPRKDFEGTRGSGPASEPETRAIMDFVEAHPNIVMFLDWHNDASCLFFWRPGDDAAAYNAVAARAQEELGYEPKPLEHEGVGLSIAWASGKLGILSFIVELGRGEPWKEDTFIRARPFMHPQLGEVLIGSDDAKLARRNPHPSQIAAFSERHWGWLKKELAELPRLEVEDPRILPDGSGGFQVSGWLTCTGSLPADTHRAAALGRASAVGFSADGATVAVPEEVALPGAGERRRFRVTLAEAGDDVTLVIRHPRAGTVRVPINRPAHPTRPIRREYSVLEGYATPDHARRANNEFYDDGRSEVERGPAFTVPERHGRLRVGVLLGEWKDYRHVVPASEFERMLFSDGGYSDRSLSGQTVYGSLHDMYEEMSYGKEDVSGRVFDWVELPGCREDFEKASFGSDIVQKSLQKAVLAREGPEALDGFDALVFIWAGNPLRRTSALWPMRLKLKDRPDTVAFKMGEMYKGQVVAVGVPSHELGHTFGVNDKYGLGATRNPFGPWCLIDRGTHGAEPSGDHRPFHFCAWCKAVIGWVEPVVIDPTKPQKLALRPILHGPAECFRILLVPDGSEYLLLENRRREGFFTDLPSPGLAVLRVGPNDRPGSPQTRVQLLAAHGLPPVRRGIPADFARIAWPQEGHTELVVNGVRLSDIRLVDDVVYFEVGPADQ